MPDSNAMNIFGGAPDPNAYKTPATVVKDKRVCTCGHPASAHATQSANRTVREAWQRMGKDRCKTGKTTCPCDGFIEVLQSEKMNHFVFRTTTGGQTGHALYRGVAKAVAAGKTVEWTNANALQCVICRKMEPPLYIAAMTLAGRVSEEPQPKNVFLCEKHYVSQGGVLHSNHDE